VLSLAALAQQLPQFSLDATAACSDAGSERIVTKPRCRNMALCKMANAVLSDEKSFKFCIYRLLADEEQQNITHYTVYVN